MVNRSRKGDRRNRPDLSRLGHRRRGLVHQSHRLHPRGRRRPSNMLVAHVSVRLQRGPAPNHRVNPAAGCGLAAEWRPRSPAAPDVER